MRKRADGSEFAHCRLVSKEIAYYSRDDVNAGTPPLCVIRFLIIMASTPRRAGQRARKIALHDAEVAFFPAFLDEWICIPKPPAGAAPPGYGWQLRKALSGTRRASQL